MAPGIYQLTVYLGKSEIDFSEFTTFSISELGNGDIHPYHAHDRMTEGARTRSRYDWVFFSERDFEFNSRYEGESCL
jgi:hypothetical protein